MKYCIHGHFYQPPREDPISNYIPDEIGAEPFNNWNERIFSECYEPNARSGNFSRISFNIGPTLFKWMEATHHDVYDLIISQERWNHEKFRAGNAIAQGYNHIILPLATKLDKITQIRWGINDFQYRFGHAPKGMWLPETAVDTETLCVMSDQGLQFTILAPWQISPSETINGPFLVELPSNRPPFIVFPYDRDISTQVSFMPKSTSNGDLFLDNLKRHDHKDQSSLRLFASDGELYGHHQTFRDHFLTYITGLGAERHGVEWTWPEKWLLENQVTAIAKLNEFTSWSCLHGVERWRAQCGCTPEADWKLPMRHALDQLAIWIDSVYENEIGSIMDDLWELRHRYTEVMNNQLSLRELFCVITGHEIDGIKLKQVDLLLRAQYERQRMYTSCGFYFDEFHRIEPQNSIAYAANASWLTEKATGGKLPSELMNLFKLVRSNKTGLRADTVFSQTLLRAEAEVY